MRRAVATLFAAFGASVLMACGGRVIIATGGAAGSSAGEGGSSAAGTGGNVAGTGGNAAGTGGAAAGSGGSGATAGTAGSGGTDPGCGSLACQPLEECDTVLATGTKVCASKSMTVSPPGGRSYTIDATETTYDQYQAWLATAPSFPPAALASTCSWKNSGYNAGFGSGNKPVAMVDWCDAFSYCTAIGKRLCGNIAGGATAYIDSADPAQDQWFNACTSGDPGHHIYPYGNDYDQHACNGYDNGVEAAVGVGVISACASPVAGYAGIFDLSGNVWEWEDSCYSTTGPNAMCLIRGGSFYHWDYGDPLGLRCLVFEGYNRNGASQSVGFRCCSSAPV